MAVKDARSRAAQRSKILDGEGHGHTLSRAARPQHQPSSLTPRPDQPVLTAYFSQRLTHHAHNALPVAIPALNGKRDPSVCGPRCPARLRGRHDNHDTTHRQLTQPSGARSWLAPRRPGAKRS